MDEHMSILAVGAHPDDMEILCAGTLARYAQDGHRVSMCHVCTGHLGHVTIPPDELIEIRRGEAEAAARVIGADSYALGIPDLEAKDDRDATERLVNIIRITKPDLIITHSPDDYMRDHLAVQKLVDIASFAATIPHYQGVEGEAHSVTPIAFMDTMMGVGFIPDDYVDVTNSFEAKKEMLRCHKSQVDWLKDHDNIDVVSNMEVCSKYRGLQCGVDHAEGFTHQHTWPRMRPERLLP